MKKVSIIIIVIVGGVIVLSGVLYGYKQIKMNDFVTEAVDEIERPYYEKLASICSQKHESEKRCCISSVYSMIEIDAKEISDVVECTGRVDQLKCLGSFKWCDENAKK